VEAHGIRFCDNPHEVRLYDFHFSCKEQWVYEYDLTDCWQHKIRLEQILTLDPEQSHPVFLAGKRLHRLKSVVASWRPWHSETSIPYSKSLRSFFYYAASS
jgi:hypothetical protein